MGGNVGYSFARLVMDARASSKTSNPIYVLELSSFQLDDIETFRPDVSMILNITPDHLDRYDYQLENYVQSKFRITLNQKRGDLILLNGQDPITQEHIAKTRWKSTAKTVMLTLKTDKLPIVSFGRTSVFDLAKTRLLGPHNAYNAKSALAACLHLKANARLLANGLETYLPPATSHGDSSKASGHHVDKRLQSHQCRFCVFCAAICFRACHLDSGRHR